MRRSATSILLAVCVSAFVAVAGVQYAGLASRREILAVFGCSYEGLFAEGRAYQLITAAFLHGDILHLVFNVLALWMLGPAVEGVMGTPRYLFLSIICAVSGFAGFLLFDQTGTVVGYSGVLFGIMVAQAIYFPASRIHLFGFFPLQMKHAVILLGAIELYLTVVPGTGRIANAAHLFGALAAAVYLLPGRLLRGRRRVMPAVLPPLPAVPTPRDWGPAGSGIVAALRAIDAGDPTGARGGIRWYSAPWGLRTCCRRILRLAHVVQRFEADASESARRALERQIGVVWDELVKRQLFAGLPPLASIGLRGGEVAPRLIRTLADPSIRMTATDRGGLESVIAATGSAGLVLLLEHVSQTEASAQLSLSLAAIDLRRHAPTVMRFYGETDGERRRRLISRLSQLKDHDAGKLCDLLAGSCDRVPADLRLLRDVQREIGASELRRIAARWAAGGHPGARALLRTVDEDPGRPG